MFPKINSIINLAVNALMILLILWGLSSGDRPDTDLLLVLIGFLAGAGIFVLFDTWSLRLYSMNKMERVAGSGFKTTGIVLVVLASITSAVVVFAAFSAIMDLSGSDTDLSDKRLILSMITIGIILFILLGSILNIIFFIKALKKNNALFSGMINTIGEEPA